MIVFTKILLSPAESSFNGLGHPGIVSKTSLMLEPPVGFARHKSEVKSVVFMVANSNLKLNYMNHVQMFSYLSKFSPLQK